MQNKPKIAIVCDWLIGGGAEKVIYELHLLYPEAPIYASYCSDSWRKQLSPAKVKTGYLNFWLFYKMRKFIPFLRILWFSRINLSGYDIVISVTGAEAKAIKVPNGIHVSYCNVTHYYWGKYEEYLDSPGFGRLDFLARFGLRTFVKPMRKWDYKAAQKPDLLVANSNHTKRQIKKYYGRDSSVIHPPVDIEKFSKVHSVNPNGAKNSFTAIGRLTNWKRIDLAIKACSKNNLPLTVVGDGPEMKKLKSIAGPTIEFTGWIDNDKKLTEIINNSIGFIFPGHDDFGIIAVEALASGTPVIAYKDGGALDYIKPGKNGEFFEKQTVKSLSDALSKFDSSKYTSSEIIRSADSFSIEVFRKKITNLVDSL